jgi:hypothetical protein
MKRLLFIVAIVALATVTWMTATASAASKASYYLSLGDSLAAGADKQYPDQLFKAVREDYKQLKLVKLGCGGETALGMIVGSVGCAPGIYAHGSQLNEAVAFSRPTLARWRSSRSTSEPTTFSGYTDASISRPS